MSVIQFSCHYNVLYSHLIRKVLKRFLKKFWEKHPLKIHIYMQYKISQVLQQKIIQIDNSEIKIFKLYRQNQVKKVIRRGLSWCDLTSTKLVRSDERKMMLNFKFMNRHQMSSLHRM